MKVTVCFGNVWVVVPCGDGLHSVQDLMSRAALRYRKASGQPHDSWVTVHALRSVDGGLLDPDDRVCDVTDDREQLVAEYGVSAAAGPPSGPPSAGGLAPSVGAVGAGGGCGRGYPGVADGTSASSDEASRSPVPFTNGDHRFQPFSRVDIEVTGSESDHSSCLQVRRGSESALNQLQPSAVVVSSSASADQLAEISCKRWSAAPIIDDQVQAQSTPIKKPPPGEREQGSGDERERAPHPVPPYKDSGHFRRNFLRLSMQTSGLNGSWRWPDSSHHQRWEPVGRSSSRASADPSSSDFVDGTGHYPADEEAPFRELVVLSQVSGSLGIHVVPDSGRLWLNSGGCSSGAGLRVQYIEPDGVVDRDGRIRVGDIIAEINSTPLRAVSFQKAQEIFIAAAKTGEMRLMVDHVSAGDSSKITTTTSHHGGLPVPPRDQQLPPRPVFPRSASDLSARDVRGVSNLQPSRVAAVSPTKKQQQQTVRASSSASSTVTGGGAGGLLAANTRRLGRRLSVRLLKTSAGLGFSLTTRDNQAAGPAPIYIKNIQPQGAAIEDGTLRPGDRLLEVNSSPVTGLSQHQLVELLRAVPIGQSVHVTVSRQEPTAAATAAAGGGGEGGKRDADSSSPRLPRPLPDDPMEDIDTEMSVYSHLEACDILSLDIPVHDSERAGLGVSVKGKTTPPPSGVELGDSSVRVPPSSGMSDGGSSGCDAGIFVKSVMCGGAAGKDGRLQRNDQLLKINGVSLLGMSNRQAMETLRRAMYERSDGGGMISLVVARRRDVCTSASSGRESVNSMLSSSSGELLTGWRTLSAADDSTARAADNDTHPAVSESAPGPSELPMPRHSAVDRVVALSNRANLRNDSYCRATHETSWSSPQVNNDNNNNSQSLLSSSQSPGSCSKFPPGINLECPANVSGEISADGDVAYASQLSLEHAGVGFTRDQPGRRSMSEKRHASRDAKSTDTYQRTRRARDDRQRQRLLLASQLTADDIGPNLGMKKSSSLESLQTMVHELVMEEDRVPSRGSPVGGAAAPGTSTNAVGPVTVVPMAGRQGMGKSPSGVQVVRGRGCNESFRAAVDRSYEAPLGPDMAPLGQAGQMETLDEYVDNHFIRDRVVRHSSLSSGAVEGKKGKRRSTLLKGLGSMFGFGRQPRGKPVDTSLASLSPQVTMATTLPRPASAAAGVPLSSDQLRAQQARLNRAVTRQLAEQQQQQQKEQQQNGTDTRNVDVSSMPVTTSVHAPASVTVHPPVPSSITSCITSSVTSPSVTSTGEGVSEMSRHDRITQLRQQHQRRHASRSGVYVTDAAEERAEQHMRQMLSSESTAGNSACVPPYPPQPAAPHLRHQLSGSVKDHVNNNNLTLQQRELSQQQQRELSQQQQRELSQQQQRELSQLQQRELSQQQQRELSQQQQRELSQQQQRELSQLQQRELSQQQQRELSQQQQRELSQQQQAVKPSRHMSPHTPWFPPTQQRYADSSFIHPTDPIPDYNFPYNGHPPPSNNNCVVSLQQKQQHHPRPPLAYRSVSNFGPVSNSVRHQVYRSQRGARSSASSDYHHHPHPHPHHHQQQQLRPGSNYYEYESVEAMLRLGGGGGGQTRPLPPGSVHHRSLPRTGVRQQRNQQQQQPQQRQLPPHAPQHHERTSSVPVPLHSSQGSSSRTTLLTVPRRGHAGVPPPPPRPPHMKMADRFPRQSDAPFQPGSHV